LDIEKVSKTTQAAHNLSAFWYLTNGPGLSDISRYARCDIIRLCGWRYFAASRKVIFPARL